MRRRLLPSRSGPGVGLAAAAVTALLLAPAAGASTAPAVSATPVPAPPGAPAVVLPAAGLEADPAAGGDAAVAAAVAKALSAPDLGRDVSASVVDVATGDVVLADDASTPQMPASTLKTLTAITVLSALGPQARLTTRVALGSAPAEIVLVGAGDATLARAPLPDRLLPEGQAARPASLAELARETVHALQSRGLTSVTLRIDDSLFVGPRTAPGWPATYVSTGVVSPVSALSADGGRSSATSRTRSSDPALAAGLWFAARLRDAGIEVADGITRTIASKDAATLASVESPTVAELVERALTTSDNDLAEALAHLAGIAVVGKGSFEGGAEATAQTLAALGVGVEGMRLVDGSGLSRRNVVSTSTIAAALAAAVRDVPPVGASAGVLWPTTTGLPIAGVTGTLAERFDTPGTDLGRGVVRAKTGTLSGVVTLAGVVRDETGRMRVFVFLADRSPGPLLEAQAALDRAATAVASG